MIKEEYSKSVDNNSMIVLRWRSSGGASPLTVGFAPHQKNSFLVAGSPRIGVGEGTKL